MTGSGIGVCASANANARARLQPRAGAQAGVDYQPHSAQGGHTQPLHLVGEQAQLVSQLLGVQPQPSPCATTGNALSSNGRSGTSCSRANYA